MERKNVIYAKEKGMLKGSGHKRIKERKEVGSVADDFFDQVIVILRVALSKEGEEERKRRDAGKKGMQQ